jgi:hypothetical protein
VLLVPSLSWQTVGSCFPQIEVEKSHHVIIASKTWMAFRMEQNDRT